MGETFHNWKVLTIPVDLFLRKNCSNDHDMPELPSLLADQLRRVLPPGHGPAATAEPMPPAPGAYVLLIELAEPLAVALPGRPEAVLAPGWYAYCGSARGPGGLRARLARHLAADKRRRWHVDRLTMVARRRLAIAFADETTECALAARLAASGRFGHPIPGFGSSDCRTCPSHLLEWQGAPDRSDAPTDL